MVRPLDTNETATTPHPSHTHGMPVGAVAGEAIGALIGSAAGPVGVAAGMLIGAAAGALAGKVYDQEAERQSTHDRELDEAIGVTGKDLGRPSRPPGASDPFPQAIDPFKKG